MGTKHIFITRENKRRNFEIDSAAPSVGKGKYTQHVSYYWPPVEAALSVLIAFRAKNVFEKLMKTQDIAINAGS